jgi:branched-subunit amino acid transport protein
MEDFHIASIVVSTIRNAPVLMFAALAGLFAERSGVVDIGLEGKILASAFVSAAVGYTTQNPWLGIAAGIAVSVALAMVQQLGVDRFDGADVDAAGRLADQHQLRLGRDFARDHDLLLVAAREQADTQVRIIRTHVEGLQQMRAALGDGLEVEQAPAVFHTVLVAEHGVLHHREILDDAVAQAVFRHVADAEVAEGGGQAVGIRAAPERKRFAFEFDLARRRQAHARQDFHQFALAVARDAGNRHDFARTHGEVDVGQQLDAVRVFQLQARDLEHRRARIEGFARQVAFDRAADHHVGQLLFRRLGGGHGARHAAGAQHRHLVGDVHDLLQLVGDQDDGLALFLEQAQDFEQRGRFLGRQHGGRLVQDQDVGAAVDLLEDFDALLGAHG